MQVHGADDHAEDIRWDQAGLFGTNADHTHQYAIGSAESPALPSPAPDENGRCNREHTG